jgi:hypothetical protein
MNDKPDSRATAARSAASLEACPEPGRRTDLNPQPPVPSPVEGPALSRAEGALAVEPEPAAPSVDLSAYTWVPVLRKPRKDGWTPQRQRDFIAALADTGCVERAAMQVQMSRESCYRLRRSPGAESFSAAWDVALQHAARVLLDVVFQRAFEGSTEPVFNRDGERTGTRYRQNDRLAMFVLRAYMPERFRHAHRDWRAPDEPLPPSALAAPPMAETLRLLQPEPPAEPHQLLDPDELEDALFVADTLPPGELPRWHRGVGDCEPVESPLHPEVEAELERLKRGEPYSDTRPQGWKGKHPGSDLE